MSNNTIMAYKSLQESDDIYFTSSRIVDLIELLHKLHIIKLHSAYHSEGRLHVVIEQ